MLENTPLLASGIDLFVVVKKVFWLIPHKELIPLDKKSKNEIGQNWP